MNDDCRWLGDGPRMVRDIFSKARENAPCIIFIDEVGMSEWIDCRLMLLPEREVVMLVQVIEKSNVS